MNPDTMPAVLSALRLAIQTLDTDGSHLASVFADRLSLVRKDLCAAVAEAEAEIRTAQTIALKAENRAYNDRMFS